MKYFNAYIRRAMEMFYQQDRDLIKYNVHEQAMSARIAHYLVEIIEGKRGFNGIKVDCEYNKMICDPKRLGADNKIHIPDIIVHSRGDNSKNKFVIEIKKRKFSPDEGKIKRYVDILEYEEGYAIQKIKKDSFYVYFYKRVGRIEKRANFNVTTRWRIKPAI